MKLTYSMKEPEFMVFYDFSWWENVMDGPWLECNGHACGNVGSVVYCMVNVYINTMYLCMYM